MRVHVAAQMMLGSLCCRGYCLERGYSVAHSSFAGHFAVEGSETYRESLHGAERVPVVHGELVF